MGLQQHDFVRAAFGFSIFLLVLSAPLLGEISYNNKQKGQPIRGVNKLNTKRKDQMAVLHITEVQQHNFIANGDMRIASFGTTLEGVFKTTYTLDHWLFSAIGGTGAHWDISQENGGGVNGNAKWMKIQCKKAFTDLESENGYTQMISNQTEEWDAQSVLGGKRTAKDLQNGNGYMKELSLSFDVKACIADCSHIKFPAKLAVRISAYPREPKHIGRECIVDAIIDRPDSWQRVTVRVPADTSSFGLDNGDRASFSFGFTLYGDITRITNAGVWKENSNRNKPKTIMDTRTQDSNNWADSVGNYLGITRVAAVVGSEPVEFVERPIAVDLAIAQRFYCSSYDLNIAPGTLQKLESHETPEDYRGVYQANVVADKSNQNFWHVQLPTTMRSRPVIRIFNPAKKSDPNPDPKKGTNFIYNVSGKTEHRVEVVGVSSTGFTVRPKDGRKPPLRIGDHVIFHWTASSREISPD